MGSGFGARLRQQRERQAVSLAAIAEQTKIKLSLLEGLERDDLSHWPAGIFRRSYVRAYASAIGLDPDATVRELLEMHPDPVDDIPTMIAEARGAGGGTGRRRPPTRLRFLIDSAIGALPARRGASRDSAGPAPGSPPEADIDAPPETLAAAGDDTALPEIAGHAEAPETGGTAPVTSAAAVEASLAEAHESNAPPAACTPACVEFAAVAQLCTRLGRALEAREVTPVLEDAATALDAVGLILWMWDPRAVALNPVFAHGYSDRVLAQLGAVPHDADNAIAAAFRTGETRIVNGNDASTGAVVVPLVPPSGCAGVLAIELWNGGEQRECVRASAAILAAQLSTFVGYRALPHAVNA